MVAVVSGNSQNSNLVNPDLVEENPISVQPGGHSNEVVVDQTTTSSLIINQSADFEFKLKEIDSAIQLFEEDNPATPRNSMVIIDKNSNGKIIGEDEAELNFQTEDVGRIEENQSREDLNTNPQSHRN